MSAKQELRTFFRGSPLSLIYKAPLLILVTAIYTIYSLMKISIRQLPIVIHYMSNYIVQFYDTVLVNVPFYVNDYLLLNLHYVLLRIKNIVITSYQQFYRSIISPIARIGYTVVMIQLPQLIKDTMKPVYLFIVMYVMPYISQYMKKCLAMSKHYFIILYMLLIQLFKRLFKLMKGFSYYILKLFFLILVNLARNLIYAYHVAKSIYLQYVLPCLTHLTTLFWCMSIQINKMVSSLADILQRFNRFCFHTIVQPLVHFMSMMPSFMITVGIELRKHVDDAIHIVHQFIDQMVQYIR